LIKFCAERNLPDGNETCANIYANTIIANSVWRVHGRLGKRAGSSPELFPVEASPGPGTRSRELREHTREMTLIGKAASERHFRQR
jgi:hypothetical protein